ncbi:hypothetical protein CRYUN_Cryun25bG0049200 [Craigia yunnanensis]
MQGNLSFPLICPDWNVDEEILLLVGIEMYGFGNWTEVIEHVGTKSKSQCIDHYNAIYMNSPCFPLPDLSHVMGKSKEGLLAMAKGNGQVKKGIMFQDITTLLLDPKAFKDTMDLFVERYKGKNISVVVDLIQSFLRTFLSSLISIKEGGVRAYKKVAPVETRVFLFQKVALYKCNMAGKPAVVTRVVDSMTNNLRPTRAEATDVGNAILDDLSLLVITKGLTKTGDDYEVKAAHVELVERMRKVSEVYV